MISEVYVAFFCLVFQVLHYCIYIVAISFYLYSIMLLLNDHDQGFNNMSELQISSPANPGIVRLSSLWVGNSCELQGEEIEADHSQTPDFDRFCQCRADPSHYTQLTKRDVAPRTGQLR